MSRRAWLGAALLAVVALAVALAPPRRVAYTTAPDQVVAILRALLPTARVPAGFVGTLAVERSLAILAGPRRQLLAVLAGPPEELERVVGEPGELRRVVRVQGNLSLLAQGPADLDLAGLLAELSGRPGRP